MFNQLKQKYSYNREIPDIHYIPFDEQIIQKWSIFMFHSKSEDKIRSEDLRHVSFKMVENPTLLR